MAIEKCGLLGGPHSVRRPWRHVRPLRPHVYCCHCPKYDHLHVFPTYLQTEYTRHVRNTVHVVKNTKKGTLKIFHEILKLKLSIYTEGSKSSFTSILCITLITVYLLLHTSVCVYTRCPRRNVQYFGRVFLMLNYTDISQNTYIQSWTVTDIMAREVWNFDSCYTLTDCQIHIETGRNMWFL